jgi:hypothetical protein
MLSSLSYNAAEWRLDPASADRGRDADLIEVGQSNRSTDPLDRAERR